VSNCETCNDDICTECNSGYLLDLDTIECVSNDCSSISECKYCLTSDVCLACSLGYHPTSDGSKCSSNSEGCSIEEDSTCYLCDSYYYSDGEQCKACPIADCLLCDSDFCYSCEPGKYYDISSNTCVDDDVANCEIVGDLDGTCNVCEPGYYVDIFDGSCSACASPCKYCDGSSLDDCIVCSLDQYRYLDIDTESSSCVDSCTSSEEVF